MRRHASISAVLVLLMAAGCGNQRNSSGLDEPRAAPTTKKVSYPSAGVTVSVPRNLVVKRSAPPGVFRASLGERSLSVWAYPRREQLPRSKGELAAARKRLVRAAEKREKSFRLRSAMATRAADGPAIELVGDQTIDGARLRTHSLHVYRGRAEYVVEVIAPVREFRRFDNPLWPAVRTTLGLTGRVKEPAAKGAEKEKSAKPKSG